MKKLGKVFVCLIAVLSMSNVVFAKVGDNNTLMINGYQIDLGEF